MNMKHIVTVTKKWEFWASMFSSLACNPQPAYSKVLLIPLLGLPNSHTVQYNSAIECGDQYINIHKEDVSFFVN